MRRRTITPEECAKFNALRKEFEGKVFSFKEFQTLLKERVGIGDGYFISGLVGRHAIKYENGSYSFFSDPVHITKLQSAWDLGKEKKKATPAYQKRLAQNKCPLTTLEMISLLKQEGYQIRKPQLDTEAAMQNPSKPVSDFISYIDC